MPNTLSAAALKRYRSRDRETIGPNVCVLYNILKTQGIGNVYILAINNYILFYFPRYNFYGTCELLGHTLGPLLLRFY